MSKAKSTEKVRVYALAKELELASKELLEKLQGLGYEVKSIQSSLLRSEADKAIKALTKKTKKAPAKAKKSSAKTKSVTEKKAATKKTTKKAASKKVAKEEVEEKPKKTRAKKAKVEKAASEDKAPTKTKKSPAKTKSATEKKATTKKTTKKAASKKVAKEEVEEKPKKTRAKKAKVEKAISEDKSTTKTKKAPAKTKKSSTKTKKAEDTPAKASDKKKKAAKKTTEAPKAETISVTEIVEEAVSELSNEATADTMPSAKVFAETFITNALATLNVKAEVEVKERSETEAELSVISTELKELSGYKTILNQLVYILSKSVHYKYDLNIHYILRVSVTGQEEDAPSLESLAIQLAEKMIKVGRVVYIDALNSQERRTMHTAIAESSECEAQTVSDGEGIFRRLIIAPASKKVPTSSSSDRGRRDDRGGRRDDRGGRRDDRGGRRDDRGGRRSSNHGGERRHRR